MMAEKSGFGALLRHYRQEAGLSQEALAERAGLSARSISDLERGVNRAPRRDTLELLTQALSLAAPQRDLLHAVARAAVAVRDESPSGSPPARIPLPPTPFIGREHERADALNLLRRSATRLLTLTGPSGVGKTRLALELAHALGSDLADGAVFVELAAIRDPALLPGTLVQSLGLRERKDVSPAEQVGAYLRDRHCMLVLDNVEQIPDCAPFLADLLATCPHLLLLVTSRTRLRLRAEQQLPLSPLALDAAVQLFCERASAVRPAQTYARDQVEALCTQLDCLPLALELAAMHVRLFPLTELNERLSNRLGLLRNHARDVPARQQTMADAIEWSYELLSAEQQRCFRALGVFDGWWTLAAAAAIWSGEGMPAEEDVVLMLSTLVDVSLVQVETQLGSMTQFSLLQVIREYALQQLRAAGEEQPVRRRHAGYYAGLAEQTHQFFGTEEGSRNAQLISAQELPNTRAAMQWAEEWQEAELGLRLCGFARLLYIRGQLREAEHWYERMLALDSRVRLMGKPSAPSALQAEKLNGFGRVLLGMGLMERAQTVAEESLHLAQQAEDTSGISEAYATLGLIAQASGRFPEAGSAYAASYAHAARTEQTGLISRALMNLAEIARLQDDIPRMQTLLTEALACAQAAGMKWDIATITTLLGHVALRQQDTALAKSRFRESLLLFRTFGSPTYTAWCLEAEAVALSAEAKSAQAVRLLAAAAALREQAQSPLPPLERQLADQAIAAAKAALGAQTFAQEWLAGCVLNMEDAIAYALSPVCA